MRSRRIIIGLAAVAVALSLTGAVPSIEERLERQRNLGKAFFENPTTQNEAVAEFQKASALAPGSVREKLNYALALLHAGKAERAAVLLRQVQKLDPKLPHTWFNLGIHYRKNGNAELATQQFLRMLRLTPEEPIAHYQLGALYRQAGKIAEATAEFERAAALDPLLAGARFQLYNLYRQAGRTADAAAQLQTFQELKRQAELGSTDDVDWCDYAEVYDPPRAPTSARAPGPPSFADVRLAGDVDPASAGIALIDSSGKGTVDLLVWSSRGVSLYLAGSASPSASGLGEIRGISHVAPGDFDNDGLMDLAVSTQIGTALYRNTGGAFLKTSAMPAADRIVWIDYDHDYDLDLMLVGTQPALYRNQGSAGFADRTGDFPFIAGHTVTDAQKLRVKPDSKAFDLAVFYKDRAPTIYRDELGSRYRTAAHSGTARDPKQLDADIDGDGKMDRVQVAADGSVHYLRNTSKSSGNFIRVRLAGVKSLKSGQDAEIEVKSGLLYRKQFYEGVPVTFDLEGYASADVVRITWMNGLIQNETKQAAGKTYRYEEAQRLSGSCPMVWTWDGKGFRFITDVLGVAPLGASDGDGSYFAVDHDEWISIPGEALRLRNGRYEVRITEELSEVTYLDQVQLFAVDHPAGSAVYTNEKFKAPPYPEFALFEVTRRMKPVSRTDKGGSVELDFGRAAPSGKALLLLTGWVDWPDGSMFRAASQERPGGLRMPSLAMQDAAGVWRVVNADMGMPAGKPKSIAVKVDFISGSRKLRIATDLNVHWDEIFLSEDTGAARVLQREIPLLSADLHFRGFAKATIDAAHRKPDTYSYFPVSESSYWNPTPGMYTRFGDVLDLMGRVDDRMAIFGAGDEVALRFKGDALPPVKPGWTRNFLLKVDGWAKDRDANTAHSAMVEPLPFHGMSGYPYGTGERFPQEKYRREYNTRPALRLIRPLSE